MLDQPQLLEFDYSDLHQQLLNLPSSYSGSQRVQPQPYAAVAYGEAAGPLELCSEWISHTLGATGTQFILSGGLDFGEAAEVQDIAEARGVGVSRVGMAPLEELAFRVNPSPLSFYSYAQYLAYSTGHASDAQEADAVLASLALECAFAVPTEQNPAKRLAWSLWTRTPFLLAKRTDRELTIMWQHLLARVGKSMSVALEREPLLLLTGGFEARHESGDQHLALILGQIDEEMTLCRDVLETRVDEVIEVAAPLEVGDYAAKMYLCYLGAWVSYYLSLAYRKDPADTASLKKLYKSDPHIKKDEKDDLEG